MRRALAALAAVFFLVGAAAGLAVGRSAGGGEDASLAASRASGETADPVARTLRALGTGPSGSAPVPLRRWRYREDPADRGRVNGWPDGRFAGREVVVPYSPNARDVTGPRAARAYRGSVGWFTRTIAAPVDGRYALTFGSAHHVATVYVDGRRVRRHVGAYAPFTAVATLAAGRHTVTVRVDWRDPRAQSDAGYARGWFNYGGLNRPVTLARLGDSELGALMVATRLRSSGAAEVRIGVRVRNRGRRERRLQPRGVLERGGVRISVPFPRVAVTAGGSRRVTAIVAVPDAALWSPASPQLYGVDVTVPGEAVLRRMVGLRELRWSGARLRLNGRTLRLKGVGLPADIRGHGDAWTQADEARTVRELVATGANATRSQLPLSESMLDRLDAAGILVWQELGPWETPFAFHARSVGSARDRALATAEREQAHPSVVAWTLTNEIAAPGRPEQVDYVVKTARDLHRRDRTRPVAVDLWGPRLPTHDGPLLRAVDALGVTDYTGWYEGTDLGAQAQAAAVRGRLAGLRRLLPDKPIVVTELGAVGTDRISGDGFGSLAFQAGLLGRRLRTLRELPGLSGALVWLLRDHALRPDFRGGSVLDAHPGLDLTPGLNEKGLYDYAGRPKPVLRAVRAAFGRRGR